MKKAETIEEIYKVFAPEIFLTKDDLGFYVDLYKDDLKIFITALKYNQIPTKSFFIAGQSGNGKSTVLSLLDVNYASIGEKYDLHYFSGKETFAHDDINIIDLLLMIGGYLIRDDEALQKEYFTKLNQLQELNEGVLQIETQVVDKTDKMGSASASLNFGINFLNILKSKGGLVTSYKANEELRKTAKRVFKTKEKDLIAIVNDIIFDYKAKNNSDKELLMIIDDLEKREDIDKLFLKEIHHLDSLNMIKIITMPIHLRRSQTFNTKDVREFALKLNTMSGKANDKDRELLNQVIKRRIKNLNLINKKVIDNAITHSGGNLRQIIKLIQLSALDALSFDAPTIEQKELDYAVEFLQRSLSSPAMMMQTFLKDILINKALTIDTDESLEKLGKAIKMGLVFAYFNGKIWYEINPLIKKILEEYIEITAKSR